jgi:predicted TIM-barrel fold metal-dependent hydrolase
MIVVDVDAHAEPGPDWLDDRPDLAAALSGRWPRSDPRAFILPAPTMDEEIENFALGLCGHVQRNLARDKRIDYRRVATSYHEALANPELENNWAYEGASMRPPVDAAKRAEWLVKMDISAQNLVNVMGMSLAQRVDDPHLGMRAIEHLNTYMADRVEGYTDRQKLVTSVRFEDMNWAIAELTRMRARGSRSFIIPGEPVDLVPPYASYYDRLYAAAVDLGMVMLMHVGSGPNYWHPGWGNTDDPRMIRYLGSAGSHTNATLMINALVFGGVFERHPKLTLQISEFGVGWAPFTVANMDGRASKRAERIHGPYPYPLKPSEYVSRNIRISGLPGQDPCEALEKVPGTVVFCSDYPHFEGHPDPVNYYQEMVKDQPRQVQEDYFGGSMLKSYEMMGDPLV